MLIALLAILGVDLIVIVVLLGAVLARKRWVVRRPGAFRGQIRVASGEIDGFRPKWSRGYGRWIRDVLVWTKAPLYLQNEFLASDGLDAEGPADPDHVKRLGDQPVVIRLRTDGATAEVAADRDERELLIGPYLKPVGATGSGHSAPGTPPLGGELPRSGGHSSTT
jgi:hypothetical protein